MLRGVQGLGAGTERSDSFGSQRSIDRDVFEFEGNDVDLFGEGLDGVEVVVVTDDFPVGDLPGGRFFVGRKNVDVIAETASGKGEHAAKLAAAKDA